MNFCEKCDNMYYIKISGEDSNSLLHYCRNCGHEDNNNMSNVCVSKTSVKKQDSKFNKLVNEYTSLDPTLPHIYTIPCPNQMCPCNTGEAQSDVIYIRYDDENIKYIYMCTHCNKIWKSNNKI